MSETKLLPCPFCGGEAVFYYDDVDSYAVGCKICCDVDPITTWEKTMESAAEKWNTRKPVDDVMERLSKEEDAWSEKYNCQKSKGFIDQYSDGFADGVLKAIGFVKEVMGLNEISND